MVTNGTLCSHAALRRLRLAGLETLLVSLDGASASVHDALRGAPGAFDHARATIEMAVAVGLSTRVLFNVMRQNQDEVASAVDLCRRLGVATLSFFRCTPAEWCSSLSTGYLADREWSELMTHVIEPRMREEAPPRLLYEPTLIADPVVAELARAANLLPSCIAKRREEVYLANDGYFYACQLALVPELRLGTCGEDICKSSNWKRLDNVEPTGCRGCEFLLACRGGCRSLAYRSSSSFEARDPRCVIEQRRIRLCPQCFTPPWGQLNSQQWNLLLPSNLLTVHP